MLMGFVRKPSIDEVLTPKPEARPRIYAYSIADAAHHGQLKVGQTTRDVKRRVAEQLKTAAIQNFTIELDGPAERDDGSIFTDHEVRDALVKKGFEKVKLEWVRCTVADAATVGGGRAQSLCASFSQRLPTPEYLQVIS